METSPFFQPFQKRSGLQKVLFCPADSEMTAQMAAANALSRDDDKQYCSKRNMHRFDHCKHRCGSGRNGARGTRNLACNDTAGQGWAGRTLFSLATS